MHGRGREDYGWSMERLGTVMEAGDGVEMGSRWGVDGSDNGTRHGPEPLGGDKYTVISSRCSTSERVSGSAAW